MASGDALDQALAAFRDPSRVPELRERPLADEVILVLRVAAGDQSALAIARQRTDDADEQLLEAAIFYLQQVLFTPTANAYRVLGCRVDAAQDRLRENYRWLIKWLHPDRNADQWESVYADKVNIAWQAVKTPARRERYNQENGISSEDWDESPTSMALHTGARANQPPRSGGKELLSGNMLRHLPAITLSGMGLGAAVLLGLMYLSNRDPVVAPTATLGTTSTEPGGAAPQQASAPAASAVSKADPVDVRLAATDQASEPPAASEARATFEDPQIQSAVADLLAAAEDAAVDAGGLSPQGPEGTENQGSSSIDGELAAQVNPAEPSAVDNGDDAETALALAALSATERVDASQDSPLPTQRSATLAVQDSSPDKAAVPTPPPAQTVPVQVASVPDPTVIRPPEGPAAQTSPKPAPAARSPASVALASNVPPRAGDHTPSTAGRTAAAPTPPSAEVATVSAPARSRPKPVAVPSAVAAAPMANTDRSPATAARSEPSPKPPAVDSEVTLATRSADSKPPAAQQGVVTASMTPRVPASRPPAAVNAPPSPVPPSATQAAAVVRDFASAYTAGDLGKLDQLFAGSSSRHPGLKGMRERMQGSQMRYLELADVRWEMADSSAIGYANYRETFVPQGERKAITRSGNLRWVIEMNGSEALIAGFRVQ